MRAEHDSDAVTVANHLLVVTGAALRSGDFDSFARCFHLPNTLATIGGTRVLHHMDDLRDTFETIRAHYNRLGLHRLDRRIAAALFDGSDTIRSCHVTRFLDARGADVRPAVASLGQIERFGADWRITRSQYTVHADSEHGRALMGAPKQISPDEAGASAAEAVFQSVLDRVSRAYLENREDLLHASVRLPLFVQASRSNKVFNTPEELSADFRHYVTRFLVHRVTDTVRRVLHAQMVGERRIHGAYRTHVLSGTQLVIPAYTSAMTIEQGEDRFWRMTSIVHPMGYLTLESPARGEPDGTATPEGFT